MLDRVRDRFARGRLARRVVTNSAWLFADRVSRLAIGLVVGAWVARYLGPGEFGKLSYATAIVGLFLAFAELALESVTVRALVARPEAATVILGSAFVLRIVGGMFGIALSCAIAWVLHPSDGELTIMVVLIAATFLVTPFHVADFFFQARLENRLPIAGRFVAFIVTNLVRIWLIAVGASVVAFAAVPLLECLLGAIALGVAARTIGHDIFAWRYDRGEMVVLLKQAAPLMAAGLAFLALSRIDQLLVGAFLGTESVGVYAAAARLTEAAHFALASFAIPLLPALVALREHDPQRFKEEFERLLTTLFGVGVIAAVALSVTAPVIVNGLYGSEFERASDVLVVHAWTLAFGLVGAAVAGYLVTENLPWYSLFRSVGALLVCVGLNIILLPRVGLIGAAWAAVGASFAALTIILVPRRTRPVGRMIASAIVARRLLSERKS